MLKQRVLHAVSSALKNASGFARRSPPCCEIRLVRVCSGTRHTMHEDQNACPDFIMRQVAQSMSMRAFANGAAREEMECRQCPL